MRFQFFYGNKNKDHNPDSGGSMHLCAIHQNAIIFTAVTLHLKMFFKITQVTQEVQTQSIFCKESLHLPLAQNTTTRIICKQFN
jgi:hypothetical protein